MVYQIPRFIFHYHSGSKHSCLPALCEDGTPGAYFQVVCEAYRPKIVHGPKWMGDVFMQPPGMGVKIRPEGAGFQWVGNMGCSEVTEAESCVTSPEHLSLEMHGSVSREELVEECRIENFQSPPNGPHGADPFPSSI